MGEPRTEAGQKLNDAYWHIGELSPPEFQQTIVDIENEAALLEEGRLAFVSDGVASSDVSQAALIEANRRWPNDTRTSANRRDAFISGAEWQARQ